MVGAATDGYCEIGNLEMPITPASMIKMAITHAKIGLSIKNLAMFLPFYYCAAEAADLVAEAACTADAISDSEAVCTLVAGTDALGAAAEDAGCLLAGCHSFG